MCDLLYRPSHERSRLFSGFDSLLYVDNRVNSIFLHQFGKCGRLSIKIFSRVFANHLSDISVGCWCACIMESAELSKF